MDAMRAMLDELMGKERNVPLADRSNKKIHWDDPLVCKYQLCGLCPPRLFKNTKSAMGEFKLIIHLFSSSLQVRAFSCIRGVRVRISRGPPRMGEHYGGFQEGRPTGPREVGLPESWYVLFCNVQKHYTFLDFSDWNAS